jgi:hypothetical protein
MLDGVILAVSRRGVPDDFLAEDHLVRRAGMTSSLLAPVAVGVSCGQKRRMVAEGRCLAFFMAKMTDDDEEAPAWPAAATGKPTASKAPAARTLSALP